jgi:beta-barrel assembly-enhancing protease
MKKKIIVLLLLCFPVLVLAQTGISFSVKPEGEVIREVNALFPGTRVIIVGINNHPTLGAYANVIYADGVQNVDLNLLNRIRFEPRNLEEFWIVKALQYDVYKNIVKHGNQYNLRKEIEKEVMDYIQYLESNDLLIYDSYLESYIQALALRLLPGTLGDGRTGSFNVKIVKDLEPNASVYTNGTVLINSGLLSMIESEEELVAVLAHELAHFALDHSVININTAVRRQLRAEFWSALVTGVAAVTDIYQGARNPYHNTGELTWATAVVSSVVANRITERMGMKFSRQQEVEADKVAAELLAFTGYSSDALSAVLSKLKEFHFSTGNYQALQGRSHPSVQQRLASLGNPGEYKNPAFDARIAFVNTFNAKQYFAIKNYQAAGDLARRNIDAGVAVEDDFMVLAAINMILYNDEDKNQEALDYISIAKSLNIYPPVNLFKQEALILFRMGYNGDAEEVLKTYLEKLLEQEAMGGYSQYLSREIEWATKMVARARFL